MDPSLETVAPLVAEARRQIAAGAKVADLTPSMREAYLDHEAMVFKTNCEAAGLDPNKVMLSALRSEPVVKLDSVRKLRAASAA